MRPAAAGPGRVLALAAAYVIAARVGLLFSVVHPSVSPVWPPSGVALAALLLFGLGAWPSIAAGALIANLMTGSGWASIGIAAGNTVEALLAAVLLQRAGFDPALRRLRDVLGLAGPAAAFATAAGASIGVASLVVSGEAGTASTWVMWWLWWAGDALGILVFTPLILTLWARPWSGASPARWLEAGLHAAAIALVGVIFFGGVVQLGASPLSLAYTVFPLVVWAALRFQQPGASLLNAAVFALSVWATIRGRGPFQRDTVGEGVIYAQVFVAVEALTALLLGAATALRREAEQEVRAGQAFLSAVETSTRVGLAAVDARGRQTYVNPAFCRMTGWTSEELVGQEPPYPYWPPEDRAALGRALEITLRGEASPEGLELRLLHRDGSTFDAHVLVAPFSTPDGAPGWLASVHDVTARKRAEDELRRSRERLTEVQRLARIGGWEWDVAKDVVTWSDELYELFQRDRGSFQATYAGFMEMVHPEDRARLAAAVEAAVRDAQTYVLEHRVRLPDGSIRVIEGRGRADVDAGGRVLRLMGTAEDVTERKQAEEERAVLLHARAAGAQAEEANRLKDQFLATLSHELRTPLNAIVGWAHLMQSESLDPATREKAVLSIVRSSRALTQLISDVLEVSRIAAGKLQLDRRPVELMRVVEGAVDTVSPAAEARRIAVTVDCAAEAEGAIVLADPHRLQQVIWNLLANAVKFTPPGGSVRVGVRRDGPELAVAVTDTGVGIAPEFLPHVFDRFRQADSGTRRAHGGLGLGLSIAHHLTELHGGGLVAESAGEGKGATFTLRIAHDAHAAHPVAVMPTAVEDAWQRAPRLTGVKVLAVEDDLASREMLEAILLRLGAEVEVADSAEGGFRLLQSFRPDVLLTDIEMAGESGYDLVQKVRRLPVESGGLTPAAAVTAHVSADDRARALKAGFDLHVQKPLQPADVGIAVAALAARRRRPSAT